MLKREQVAVEKRSSRGFAAGTETWPMDGFPLDMAALLQGYATLGPKPAVFRHLIETALSGADEPIPPLERDYARQVLSERDPHRLIDIYARAMRLTQERLAGLFDLLSHAATSAPDLADYVRELTERRAHYAGVIAEHLAEIGGLREDVTVQTAADVIFALNSSEFFLLLARDRHWEPDDFERWLADAWKRLLLPAPSV